MNTKSKEIGSLMHAAARNDHFELVRYFIDRGVKPFVFVYESNPYDMYSTAVVHQLMAEHCITKDKPCEEIIGYLKIASEYYEKSAEDFKLAAGSIDAEMFGKGIGNVIEEAIVTAVASRIIGVYIDYRTAPDISEEEKERIKWKAISRRSERRHSMCNKAIAHYNNNELDDMLKCIGKLKKM